MEGTSTQGKTNIVRLGWFPALTVQQGTASRYPCLPVTAFISLTHSGNRANVERAVVGYAALLRAETEAAYFSTDCCVVV